MNFSLKKIGNSVNKSQNLKGGKTLPLTSLLKFVGLSNEGRGNVLPPLLNHRKLKHRKFMCNK